MGFTLLECSLSEEGLQHMPWMSTLLHECVYSWQECISLLFGYLSIVCWLNAQMPQVIKNYRQENAESLSISFLTVWLIGDVANLIGCTITGQLPFQLYLSIYYIVIDTFLCIQWIYYVQYPNNTLRQWFNPNLGNKKVQKATEQSALTTVPQKTYDSYTLTYPSPHPKTTATATSALLMLGFLTFNESMTSSLSTSTQSSNDMALLETLSSVDERTLWIGRCFAWMCTFLYLSSRLPQILQNFRRRSVEGLSMALFFFAAMGNLTYCLSIFTNPHATRQSMLEAVPYIIGSAGTLMFDGTIFGQYLLFNQNRKIDYQA
ncbi:PQ loop repeat-domain-containing protein [Spinellus fusiger]|nr:PQ loop repeat-domain-containing protein [Spinellus fusiger]